MAPILALYLALLAPQATAPSPPSDTPAAQAATQLSDPSIAPLRKIGGGVNPPKLIHKADPEISQEDRKSRMTGVTLVNLIVDTNGRPQNVHVARSMADSVDAEHRIAALDLDKEAVKAVKKYRFAPATEGGKPVPVELNVEVSFQIN
jgi:TonB family protein